MLTVGRLPDDRESWLRAQGRVCFFNPKTKECEEPSRLTPADLPIGWGRKERPGWWGGQVLENL